MSHDQPELTAQQNKAIFALLSCRSVVAAARSAKVSRQTLIRWMREPEFIRAHRAARGILLDQALNGLLKLVADAVRTLNRNLRCGKPPVEVRVALAIIVLAEKAQALAELTTQIDQLREMVERARLAA